MMIAASFQAFSFTFELVGRSAMCIFNGVRYGISGFGWYMYVRNDRIWIVFNVVLSVALG